MRNRRRVAPRTAAKVAVMEDYMTQVHSPINNVAPLRNVAALVTLITRLEERAHSLPGMGTFYGPSGYGKSSAVVFASIQFQAIAVECKSTWTQKDLCLAILSEMGIFPAKRITDMVNQISEYMAIHDVPLMVDEADYLVQRKMIEIVRDIHQASDASVILVGEERLPQKLRVWERIHGRMLAWVRAEEADAGDVDHLAKIYAPGIEVEPDLQAAILKASAGSVRRICVNLNKTTEVAQMKGLKSIGVDAWGRRDFFTGETPEIRKVRRGVA